MTNLLSGKLIITLVTNMVVTEQQHVEFRDIHDGSTQRVHFSSRVIGALPNPGPVRPMPPMPPMPGQVKAQHGRIRRVVNVSNTNRLIILQGQTVQVESQNGILKVVNPSRHFGSIVCTKTNAGMRYIGGIWTNIPTVSPTNNPPIPIKPRMHFALTLSLPRLSLFADDSEPSTRILYTDATGLQAGAHYRMQASNDARKTWRDIDAIDWTSSDSEDYWRSADAVPRGSWSELHRLVSP